MAVVSSSFVPGVFVPATITELFNAPATSQVTAATIVNTTSVDAIFSLWIGGAAVGSDALISRLRVKPGMSRTLPEIVGHVIPAGEGIFAVASSPSFLGQAVSIRVSGVAIT